MRILFTVTVNICGAGDCEDVQHGGPQDGLLSFNGNVIERLL